MNRVVKLQHLWTNELEKGTMSLVNMRRLSCGFKESVRYNYLSPYAFWSMFFYLLGFMIDFEIKILIKLFKVIVAFAIKCWSFWCFEIWSNWGRIFHIDSFNRASHQHFVTSSPHLSGWTALRGILVSCV